MTLPEPLMDEHVLRRALRLDRDEAPPRLDPALIAAAATARAPRQAELVVALVVAFAGGWIWSEVFRAVVGGLLGTLGIDAVAAALELVATVALLAAPVVDAAMHPAIPIAILTAAVVAVLFERRGRSHAASS